MAADAAVSLTAASITTGGLFSAGINNNGNDITGGTIGGSASVDVQTAADMTQDILAMGIQNYNAGSITAGADVNLTVGGNLTVTSDGELNLFLNNFTGGSIGTDANISTSIAGNMSGGQIDVGIQNQGGSIGGSARTIVAITGDLVTTAGGANFFVSNFEDGTIGGKPPPRSSSAGRSPPREMRPSPSQMATPEARSSRLRP